MHDRLAIHIIMQSHKFIWHIVNLEDNFFCSLPFPGHDCILHLLLSMLLPWQVVPPLHGLLRVLYPPLQDLLQEDQDDHEDQDATSSVPE